MPAIKFDTTLMRLIKEVQEMRAALRHVTTNLPLYDVANENTPASISTDQNDYVPGNYDVLRINATANVSITGISGGVKGRFLEIINVGTGRISFPDESASSVAANRIAAPYDQTVTLLPNARARFYYDDTQQRWTVADLPNIQGAYGKRAILKSSTTIVETISDSAYTLVTPDTVDYDDWGYWDSGNGWFVIPTGESGMYSISFNMIWYSATAHDWVSDIYVTRNGTVLGTTDWIGSVFFQYNDKTGYGFSQINQTFSFFADSGDQIRVYAYQSSTIPTDRTIQVPAADCPLITLAKLS